MRDLNVVHGEFRRTADEFSFRKNVTLGSGPEMTSVDFYADWNETGEINVPTGVEARGGFWRTMLMPPCSKPKGWRARSDIGIRSKMCSESTDTISTPR